MSTSAPNISPRLRTRVVAIQSSAPAPAPIELPSSPPLRVLIRLPHVAAPPVSKWKLAFANSIVKAKKKYALGAMAVFAICLILLVSRSRHKHIEEQLPDDAPAWSGVATTSTAPAIQSATSVQTPAAVAKNWGAPPWSPTPGATPPSVPASSSIAPTSPVSASPVPEQSGPALSTTTVRRPLEGNWPSLTAAAKADPSVPSMPARDPSPALVAERIDASRSRPNFTPPAAVNQPPIQGNNIQWAPAPSPSGGQPGIAKLNGNIGPATAPSSEANPPTKYRYTP